MVSEKKVRTMAKIAWYEQEECREELKDSKYYKNDYVRLHVLQTIISMTIGYILILVMVAVYNIEYLVMNAVRLDYHSIGYTVLGIYFLLLLAYGVGASIFYSVRYEKNLQKLRKYYIELKRMEKYYDELKDNTLA